MKKIYAFALCVLPLFGFSQYSFHWLTDDYKVDFQGADIGFEYELTNEDLVNDLSISWKFTHQLSNSAGQWEDYMCESINVCHPPQTRANTFTLGAGESIDMLHHIYTYPNGDTGTFISTAYVWETNDSANTVNVFVVKARTNLITEIDGKTVLVIDGDSFEIMGSDTVPLGIENNIAAASQSKLMQNSPNPYKGSTSIGYELESGNGMMKFHDLTGKLVMEVPLRRNDGQLTLKGELDAGIYFYSLWEDGKQIDSKRMQVID